MKPTKKTTITIIYNGEERTLPYEPDQTVLATREQAMALFGITTNQHLMALFTAEGDELTDEAQSLKAAKVKKGDELTLGQSKVRGG
jgi:hypothetical protein